MQRTPRTVSFSASSLCQCRIFQIVWCVASESTSTVGVARGSTQISFYPRQLMWLIFLLRFDASGLFTTLFDHQHLVLACRATMEAKPSDQDSVGLPVRSPDAASQNGLIHAVKGLQLHPPLIIQHTCMRACTRVSLLSPPVLSCLSLFPEQHSCYLTLQRLRRDSLVSCVEFYIDPLIRSGQRAGRVVAGLLRRPGGLCSFPVCPVLSHKWSHSSYRAFCWRVLHL